MLPFQFGRTAWTDGWLYSQHQTLKNMCYRSSSFPDNDLLGNATPPVSLSLYTNRPQDGVFIQRKTPPPSAPLLPGRRQPHPLQHRAQRTRHPPRRRRHLVLLR
ncbi:unnamed protein product, partial [Ectocarpus sp. 13 AM-2016]